jgi:hypothetical protein
MTDLGMTYHDGEVVLRCMKCLGDLLGEVESSKLKAAVVAFNAATFNICPIFEMFGMPLWNTPTRRGTWGFPKKARIPCEWLASQYQQCPVGSPEPSNIVEIHVEFEDGNILDLNVYRQRLEMELLHGLTRDPPVSAFVIISAPFHSISAFKNIKNEAEKRAKSVLLAITFISDLAAATVAPSCLTSPVPRPRCTSRGRSCSSAAEEPSTGKLSKNAIWKSSFR